MLVKVLALCFLLRILWHQQLVCFESLPSKIPGSSAGQRGNSVGENRDECENTCVHRVLLCFCLAAQSSGGCLVSSNAI